MNISIEDHTAACLDAIPIALTLYKAKRSGSSPLVIIFSATAVRRSYYRKFSEFICKSGFDVITFDYRGIGDSAYHNSVKNKFSMQDWGEKDSAAIIEWANKNVEPSHMYAVTHSAGGCMMGLAPNNNKIRGAFFVASQSGHWKYWTGFAKIKMFCIWNFLVPGLSRIFGYFPASKVGLGEDMSASLALEWARWGRANDYALKYAGRHNIDRYAGRILSVSIFDDAFATKEAVDEAATWFPSARVKRQHVTKAEVANTPVGHFGYFSSRFTKSLWPIALAHLQSMEKG